jgi:hypothetical protein
MRLNIKLIILTLSCHCLFAAANQALSRGEVNECITPRAFQSTGARPASGTSTVNIINGRWNRVNVEARIGDDPNPEANRSLGSRAMRRGEVWPVRSKGEDVWYRRDADPDRPNGQWTPWAHRPCYPRQSKTYSEYL